MAAALLVVAVVDVVLLVHRAMLDVVSPYDEGYHLSYVQYAYEWAIPRVGDPMQRWSEEAYACYPTYPYGQVTGVPCGVDGDSALYPEGGTNTAAYWPPVYYFFTAQVVRLLMVVSDLDPLHAARLSSCLLWVAGSLLLTVMVARASGSAILGVAAGLLAASVPAAWAIGSYVTPHSTALLVGVGLLAALRWMVGPETRGRAALPIGIGLGVLAGLTLPHALAGVAAVSLALLLGSLHRRPRGRRIALFAVALGGANVLTYLGWTALVSARAVGPTAAQPSEPPEGLVNALISNWDLFLPRFLGEVAAATPLQVQASRAAAYMTLGFMGFWLLRGGMPTQRAVAMGTAAAAPLLAVVMALQFNFPVPTRYGASLLALMLYLLAVPGTPRWVRAAVGLLTTLVVAIAWTGVASYLVMPTS